MGYRWDFSVLVTPPYAGWLLHGLATTLILGASAWCVAFPLGLLVGLVSARGATWARGLARVYVEAFRAVPLLIQMLLWFFVLPELLPAAAGRWVKRDMPDPELWTACLCLACYTAPRIAEQVRAALAGLGSGLGDAAAALGLRSGLTLRLVLMPLALRIIVPTMTSELLGIFKNASVASAIGVLEVLQQGRQVETYTFHSFEALGAVTLLYLGLTGLAVLGMGAVQRRTRLVGY